MKKVTDIYMLINSFISPYKPKTWRYPFINVACEENLLFIRVVTLWTCFCFGNKEFLIDQFYLKLPDPFYLRKIRGNLLNRIYWLFSRNFLFYKHIYSMNTFSFINNLILSKFKQNFQQWIINKIFKRWAIIKCRY